MTLREIYESIIMPPSGGVINYDSPMTTIDFISFLVHKYRATEASSNFSRTGMIPQSCLQQFAPISVTKRDKHQSPEYDAEKNFSIATIPLMAEIKNRRARSLNRAIHAVHDAETVEPYFPTHHAHMMTLRGSSPTTRYYTVMGSEIMLFPACKAISIIGIASNPMKVLVRDETLKISGSLIIGLSYKVTNGSIVHNSITRNAPATFTAVNSDFTGTGKVLYNGDSRYLTVDDEYPLPQIFLEPIRARIWANELNTLLTIPADNNVNAQSQQSGKKVPQGSSVSDNQEE